LTPEEVDRIAKTLHKQGIDTIHKMEELQRDDQTAAFLDFLQDIDGFFETHVRQYPAGVPKKPVWVVNAALTLQDMANAIERDDTDGMVAAAFDGVAHAALGSNPWTAALDLVLTKAFGRDWPSKSVILFYDIPDCMWTDSCPRELTDEEKENKKRLEAEDEAERACKGEGAEPEEDPALYEQDCTADYCPVDPSFFDRLPDEETWEYNVRTGSFDPKTGLERE
jgi:hypothetical protein